MWGYNNIPETLSIYLTDSYKNVKHSFQPQRRICSHVISTLIIYICTNCPQYYSRDDFQNNLAEERRKGDHTFNWSYLIIRVFLLTLFLCQCFLWSYQYCALLKHLTPNIVLFLFVILTKDIMFIKYIQPCHFKIIINLKQSHL